MLKRKRRDYEAEIRELEERIAALRKEAREVMNREAWARTRRNILHEREG